MWEINGSAHRTMYTTSRIIQLMNVCLIVLRYWVLLGSRAEILADFRSLLHSGQYCLECHRCRISPVMSQIAMPVFLVRQTPDMTITGDNVNNLSPSTSVTHGITCFVRIMSQICWVALTLWGCRLLEILVLWVTNDDLAIIMHENKFWMFTCNW